jgi:hypothetical protein
MEENKSIPGRARGARKRGSWCGASDSTAVPAKIVARQTGGYFISAYVNENIE